MLITRKERDKKPLETFTGERIYELIGRQERSGGTTKHSLAYVVIPPNCSSQLHFHPKEEETYYILQGKGRMFIENKKYLVKPGDTIFIAPLEKHQIFTEGNSDLEFIAICAPAWEPDNSVFLDE
ncbi:MAG: cupin domain-containing protein [Candidatus Hodarchaeota archaeon]